MSKWFFSNNGEVSGPLDLTESLDFIADKTDLYAWHKSYTHWVPVSCIDEFEITITPPPLPIELPCTDSYEESELLSTLDLIENKAEIISSYIHEIGSDLKTYSKTTYNLTEEVKTVIKSIEEQYASLQKNLANVIKTNY